jgi:hypothetical protein
VKELKRALFKQVLDDNLGNEYNPSLFYASAWGCNGLVKYLLELGANIYNAALISASSGGHHGIIKVLLDRGANRLNEALKMTACSYGYFEDADCTRMANFLIDRGANNLDEALIIRIFSPRQIWYYRISDREGATNLNAALESALVSPYQVTIGIVKLLVKKAADNLNQALELAFERGWKDVA